jgi:hypothetical protein
MSQHTFRQAVADWFLGNPNEWHDGMVIAQIGGCYAYRTRISECRTQLGMCIENRLRKVGERTVSEYRYRPAAELTQARLFEGAA